MTKGQGGGGIRAEHYPKTKQINPEQVRPYDTRLIPAPVPDTDLCDCPHVVLCLNSEWASHLDGLLERLLYRDAWAGTDEDKDRAVQTIERLLSMFKVNDMCCCGDRKPTNQRVNPITGKIEYSYDGGQTWEEAPNSDDPRFSSPVYAPPEDLPAPGSDRRCIQAGNFVQFCKQQTDAFIADSGSWLALTGLVIAFLALLTVLGAISLGTLTPVILPLMAAIWSLGNSGFNAVMNQAAYDDLLCVLYCHIPEDGIITEAVWQQIKGAIKEEIPGTPGLYFYMYVLSCGPVGVQNMMYIPSPSSPPNCEACDACDPEWCYEFNFLITDGTFVNVSGSNYGNWSSGQGWVSELVSGSGGQSIWIKRDFVATITRVEIDVTWTNTSGRNIQVNTQDTALITDVGAAPLSHTFTWDGLRGATQLVLNPSGGAGNVVRITRLLVRGTGTNPFGTDNC